MFTPDTIQARLREQPFIPVRIITASGQAYDVTHPDLALVGESSLIIGVASNANPTYFATASRVAIFHITDMQDVPRSASTPSNGAG